MANKSNKIRNISNIPGECQESYFDLAPGAAGPLVVHGITFAGVSRLVPGYRIGQALPPRRHMIIITCAGAGTLETASDSYSLGPGSFIAVPAGIPCGWAVAGDNWKIVWFYLQPKPCWRAFESGTIISKAAYDFRYIESAAEYFVVSTGGDPTLALFYAQIMVHLLLRELGQAAVPVLPEPLTRLYEVYNAVKAQVRRNWNTDSLALRAGMSKSTLQRLALKHFGMTPWQMVIRLRMEQAALLLTKTGYQLKSIAAWCGYSDQFIFSTAFRRHFGVSPSAYRAAKPPGPAKKR
ncbi:MAG: AraC family transcriptional regulator [Victivallaceae bacterium]|nr:AraC family transcriptional regulator [Victivallaceae bacterium]